MVGQSVAALRDVKLQFIYIYWQNKLLCCSFSWSNFYYFHLYFCRRGKKHLQQVLSVTGGPDQGLVEKLTKKHLFKYLLKQGDKEIENVQVCYVKSVTINLG